MSSRSLLPVVLAADNFPTSSHDTSYPTLHPNTKEPYIPFHLTFQDYRNHLSPVGLIRPQVLAELQADDRDPETCPWQFHHEAVEGGNDEEWELDVKCVFFADWVVKGGKGEMGRAIQNAAERWRDMGKFAEALEGWRNEKYMIYASPKSSAIKYNPTIPFSNAAFALERSACAVFGLPTFGVHLTVYEGDGKDMKIWVPRRSKTKATWPSRLDNSVAGGIPAGMSPIDSMIKECDEEASLPESLVRKYIRNTGVCTYFYITEAGYLQPEIEYIYDLQLPPQDSTEYVKPHPHDDEVESFALLSITQVIDALHSGDFKPNCGLILVDFLVRHGVVTPEDEPSYLEILWHLRRRLGLAVPM